MEQHCEGKPSVATEACIGCGACGRICAHGAPVITDHKAKIDHDKCVGCGICKRGCPVQAINDQFQVNPEICISCFRCIRNCPVHAKNMDVEVYHAFAREFSSRLAERRENEYYL